MSRLGNVKVLRQCVEQEDNDEEIEGVESPAEEAGAHRMPAIGAIGRGRFRQSTHGVREKVSDVAAGSKGLIRTVRAVTDIFKACEVGEV